MTTPDLELSQHLQLIATAIEKALALASGVPHCPFVLVAMPASNAQYVANVSRQDGINLLTGLMQRWGNPNAVDLPDHQQSESIVALVEAVAIYHDIIDQLMAALISETAHTDHQFLPSKSSFWPKFVECGRRIESIKAQIATARELLDKGAIEGAPSGARPQ